MLFRSVTHPVFEMVREAVRRDGFTHPEQGQFIMLPREFEALLALENKAVVQGSIATFGTYTVDETKKTYTLKFEGSSFPNRAETEQTRAFTIAADELKVTNPSTSVGGSSELVYKRAK